MTQVYGPERRRVPPPPQTGASTLEDDLEDVILALAPYFLFAFVLAVAGAGAIFVALLRPGTLHDLMASLAGAEPKAYWYLSRSSAFVSYGLLWFSMVLGLAITNKMARVWRGGPTFAALHEHTGLLGLIFGLFHALALLGDHYIGYTFTEVMVPFAGVEYRPLWVGVGQIALYLTALVTLSFYARRWIGQKRWRLLHYLSFAVFALALIHGLFSGTDSASLLVLMMYWASFVSVLGLITSRVLSAVARQFTTTQRSTPRS